MKQNLRVAILGAIDGLLFGAAVEALRRIYTPIFLQYYLDRELETTNYVPSITKLIGGYLDIPLLCVAVFAVVTPVAYRLLSSYRISPVVLWQTSGIAAATVVVISHDWLRPFGHNTWLLPLWARWLFCLPIVSFINLVYGVIVSGWARYAERKAYS